MDTTVGWVVVGGLVAVAAFLVWWAWSHRERDEQWWDD